MSALTSSPLEEQSAVPMDTYHHDTLQTTRRMLVMRPERRHHNKLDSRPFMLYIAGAVGQSFNATL